MKRLGRNSILAALGLAIAAASGGCIVEHHYVREEPAAPAPPPPPARYDDGDRVSESARPDPGPGVELDEAYFYDRLSPYGYWRWTPDYGRVWVPAGVAADWRPYYDGHWALTEWGWTYVSDVPWAWAGYHYGRWGFGVGIGWYWIPGTVWGPAWVSWRYGGGYVAWAPLGPAGYYWGPHHRAWVAVRENHFTQPIRTVAVPSQRTAGIVARTTPQAVVTRPQQIAGGRVTAGPPPSRVSRAVGQQVRPVPVAKVLPNQGIGRAVGRVGDVNRRANPPRAYDRWNRSARPQGRWGDSSGRYGSSPRSPGAGGYAPPSARAPSGSSGSAAPHSSGSAPHSSGSAPHGSAPQSGSHGTAGAAKGK
jgi:hypothetical protein